MNTLRDRTSGHGKIIYSENGFEAFLPNKLPPKIEYDNDLQYLLSQAALSLGKLDGAIQILPNPDMFVYMFVCKEAVLSSQIEGTQSTLLDLIRKEANILVPGQPHDLPEVSNYVKALRFGIRSLENQQITASLISETHRILLEDVRGGELKPGEFRDDFVWIGPQEGNIRTATFVPPPASEVSKCMDDLINFIEAEDSIPQVIKVGLVHAQFETIHPYFDGNGRIGRLLVTLLLHQMQILHKPVLYLSLYLKARRQQYYDALQGTRDYGDWRTWIKFFLSAVTESAQHSARIAKRIIALREEVGETLLTQLGQTAANALRLHKSLYELPFTDVKRAQELLNVQYSAANRLIHSLEKLNVLVEITGHSRNRVYAYQRYIEILNDEVT